MRELQVFDMALTKKDRQREQTHRNIIETAERLFAEQGIEAVSLRQIGIEAGSLNTNVVGYYFGSKESLIDAIYGFRIPDIERVRTQLLSELDESGHGMDITELMKITWKPLYELKDKSGNHSYARFLLSVQRAGLGWTRNVLNPVYPTASEIYDRLKKILSKTNSTDHEFRLQMHLKILVGALEYIDEQRIVGEKADELFVEAIQMTSAAFLVEPG